MADRTGEDDPNPGMPRQPEHPGRLAEAGGGALGTAVADHLEGEGVLGQH